MASYLSHLWYFCMPRSVCNCSLISLNCWASLKREAIWMQNIFLAGRKNSVQIWKSRRSSANYSNVSFYFTWRGNYANTLWGELAENWTVCESAIWAWSTKFKSAGVCQLGSKVHTALQNALKHSSNIFIIDGPNAPRNNAIHRWKYVQRIRTIESWKSLASNDQNGGRKSWQLCALIEINKRFRQFLGGFHGERISLSLKWGWLKVRSR